MDSAHPVTGRPAGPPASAAPDEVRQGNLTAPARAARPAGGRERFRQSVPRLMREPLSRTAWAAGWRQCEYAVIGLLLAIPGFVFVVAAVTAGLGLSLSFAGMLAGLPLLMMSLLGARQLGEVHRRLAGRLLGVQVEPPPPLRQGTGVLGRVQARLTDPVGWRACAYLLLKLPLSA